MIEIENCKPVQIEHLKQDIDGFRTREKSQFNKDELFSTLNDELLILCHTITEGSNGAYYFQQVILRNNENQDLLINLNSFWSPLWTNNFIYDINTNSYLTSVTCYHKESNSNPLPQLLIDLDQSRITFKKKDFKIDFEKEIEKTENWIQWNQNLNICETYRKKYGM